MLRSDNIGKFGSFLLKIRVNKILIYKYLFIASIAFSVFFTRYTLDVSINGVDRNTKIQAYQEEVALTPFKASTVEHDIRTSYFGLHLKDKGYKYSELFSNLRWHELSFMSFVGVYGFMSVFAPKDYYILMGVLYIAFILFLIISILMSRDKRKLLLMTMTLFISLVMIFISSYHSWNSDFQPQGRYLFPVISIMGLLIYENKRYLNNVVTHIFIASMFLMSVYSFIFVALYRYGSSYC
jgi:hypothetical protein